MNCPRCQSPLTERERDGLTIDFCMSCRGVWLDRGELEKLTARAAKEHAELGRDDDTGQHRLPRRESHGHRTPRKKRWFETLTEFFD